MGRLRGAVERWGVLALGCAAGMPKCRGKLGFFVARFSASFAVSSGCNFGVSAGRRDAAGQGWSKEGLDMAGEWHRTRELGKFSFM